MPPVVRGKTVLRVIEIPVEDVYSDEESKQETKETQEEANEETNEENEETNEEEEKGWQLHKVRFEPKVDLSRWEGSVLKAWHYSRGIVKDIEGKKLEFKAHYKRIGSRTGNRASNFHYHSEEELVEAGLTEAGKEAMRVLLRRARENFQRDDHSWIKIDGARRDAKPAPVAIVI